MLNRITTAQIIQHGHDAIKEYDAECKTLWGKPGREGVRRKCAFRQLLEDDKLTPVEMFLKLYDFCQKEKPASRLIRRIELKLKWMMDVPAPVFSSNIHANADAALRTQELFHKKVAALKGEYGASTNNRDLAMTTVISDPYKRYKW